MAGCYIDEIVSIENNTPRSIISCDTQGHSSTNVTATVMAIEFNKGDLISCEVTQIEKNNDVYAKNQAIIVVIRAPKQNIKHKSILVVEVESADYADHRINVVIYGNIYTKPDISYTLYGNISNEVREYLLNIEIKDNPNLDIFSPNHTLIGNTIKKFIETYRESKTEYCYFYDSIYPHSSDKKLTLDVSSFLAMVIGKVEQMNYVMDYYDQKK
jgi:hypothetical protein